MKIRQPFLIWILGLVGAWMVRVWISTLRYRYRPLGLDVRPEVLAPGQRYLFAFWHEYLLLPAYHYGRPDIAVLISQHADGQLIAEICRHLGFGLVRGSTTRGGVEAIRCMLNTRREGHLAITPDGPRGPRRRVQPGLIYVAARTGIPIVPIGFGYRRARRLSSWDQFALPRFFTFATCVTLAPIRVPADSEREQLEHFRKLVEQAMLHATELAEHWAESGQQPDSALANHLAA